MLNINAKIGTWVQIIHKSGDVLMIKLCDPMHPRPKRVNLTFDDSPRNFEIHRDIQHEPARKVQA